jgi:hypothetical protein
MTKSVFCVLIVQKAEDEKQTSRNAAKKPAATHKILIMPTEAQFGFRFFL